MKKNKLLQAAATLGLAVSMVIGSAAPSYAAPRDYQCVTVEVQCTNPIKLFTGIVSKIVCNRIGHTYGRPVEVKAPSMEEEGILRYTCMLCGNKYDEAIPRLQCVHEEVDWFITEEPIEGKDGTEVAVCLTCGEEVYSFPLHMLDYENRVTIKEATETEHREVEYTCINCGAKETSIWHEYDEVNYKVLDSEDSECVVREYNCMYCDEVPYTVDYHEFEWVDNASVCKYCGFVEYEYEEPVYEEHSYVYDIVTEEHDEYGHELWMALCSDCGDSYTYPIHEMSLENEVEIGTDENGHVVVNNSCIYCGEECTYPVHDYETEEYTVLEDGVGECVVRKYSCKFCDDFYTADWHEYEWIDDEVVCIFCGDVLENEDSDSDEIEEVVED